MKLRALVMTAAAGIAAAVGLSVAGVAHAATGLSFTGGAPLPPATGYGLTRNEDGEPGLAIDGAGTIWVASDVAPYAKDDPRSSQGGTVLSGADLWKSTDNGRTYQWVADPYDVTGQKTAFLSGEDTDVTVAPAKNSSGFYNVYVASLWVGSTSVAISQDGGQTWTVDILGGVPAQDRPWVAPDGACQVYVAYHQLPTFSPVVNKYDLCSPQNSTMGETLNPVSNSQIFLANTAPGLTNAFGKIEVDGSSASKYQHNVYVPMMGCYLTQPTDYIANAESTANCPGQTQVTVAVSSDGGTTFNDYQVAIGTNNEIPVWPDTIATDAAGTVYLTWSDNNNAYLNISRDGGQTWSASQTVNTAPSLTAVYPTVAAGPTGRLDVSWYGTSAKGDSNDATKMGAPSKAGSTPWLVYDAESIDGGKTFTQVPATGTVHLGELCTHGSNCASDGSRNLLDDFGAAISPTTGHLALAYTSDQPQGAAGTAFTGFTSALSSLGGPGTNVPEAPAAGLLGLSAAAVVGGVALARRRRGR